jgi:16S rRNA (adenine1518-N6/adenine1519-N6)-dimethyltransferase
MRRVLAEQGIRLTKSLGQNFLHDANQLRRIVAAAELTKADRVLEVGPGLGPLTELLVAQAGEVLAIEKDARLVDYLRQRFERAEQCSALRLLHDDALDHVRRKERDWSGWKLVANLPYSVASPILVELALGGRASAGGRASPRAPTSGEVRAREDARPPEQPRRGPERMVVSLQIEVARRLLAKAGAPDYGLLTLLVQLEYEPRDWFKIPASCFFPEPDVDSACVCLVRRERPLLAPAERETFVQIVRRSFSQRRKMMLKLLKQDWPEPRLATEFERLRLSPQVRAEEVSLEDFARMTQALSQNPT